MQNERAVRKYNLGGILFYQTFIAQNDKKGNSKALKFLLVMKKQNNIKFKQNNYDKSYINAENQLH